MLQQTQYKAYSGQSLYDVAAAVYGDASLADDLAIENYISVTSKLAEGQIINLIEAKKNLYVLKVYESSAIIPATAATYMQDEIGGIGYMAIETSFIII
jgi:hypothetical protein